MSLLSCQQIWFLSEVEFLSWLLRQTNFYDAWHTSGTSTFRFLVEMIATPWTRSVITVPLKGCDRFPANPAKTEPCTRINTKRKERTTRHQQCDSLVRARRTTDRGTNTANERTHRVPYSLAWSPLLTICVGYLFLSLNPRKEEKEREIKRDLYNPCKPLIVFMRVTFRTTLIFAFFSIVSQW